MSKHRKPADIIAAMLSVVKVHGKKTRIMYGANLSYSLLIKYLDEAARLGLMKFNGEANGFELTDKGREYLRHYNEYSNLRDQLGAELEARKAKLVKILEAEEQPNINSKFRRKGFSIEL